ncbi:MAG: DNA-binding protein [Spirochaetae bacterium HGW-Spirochaetae-9]|nr:MAG: DNA-binding protein [Spirochaetae bacterium HGW-Spirochaetae-9]
MPRPISERLLGAPIIARVMKPAGIPASLLEEVVLGLDEAEALRLADLEGLYQEAAARSMGVSRQTFGRIVETARHKVANAILNGKALRIEGGEVAIKEKGETMMKIAVPSRDGIVDEHFGHCKEFLIFRVEGEALVEEQAIPSLEGCGCKSGVAAVLARSGVTHLVAGNMGEGAVRVLGSQGIRVVRGASGSARAAAEAFARGTLADSGLGCAGHGEAGHECNH